MTMQESAAGKRNAIEKEGQKAWKPKEKREENRKGGQSKRWKIAEQKKEN